MSDPSPLLAAILLLSAVAITCAMLFKAWEGWLQLKRLELADEQKGKAPSMASRIELADLRERVRRLEAIASGIDPQSRS